MTALAPAYDGVIFDLDGVLTDTEHLWEENWTAYAARHGHAWSAEDTAQVQGMSAPEWGAYLGRVCGDPEPAATVVDAVVDGMIAALEGGRVELADGARKLVEAMAARVPIALASSAPRRMIDAILGSTGLIAHFAATVSSEEVPRGKPSPDVYQEAARRLGLDPRRCLGIEDSSNGIRAAAAAGLTVVAIPNPVYPPKPDALALAAAAHGSLALVQRELEARLDGATLRVLLAGDRFVLNRLLREAIAREGIVGVEAVELELDWPVTPFGPVAEVHEAIGDEDELAALIADADVVVTEMAALTERVLSAAERLKLIVVARGGPVNVNVAAATARGIPVCFAPGRNASATAEYTVALLLAAARHVAVAAADLAQGHWRGDFYAYELAGSELAGKTAGLIGFGAVGSRVARILAAFGCEVLVADPYVAEADVLAVGARLVPLEELLARAQLLSLHARLTPETRHLLDAERLAQLPRGAVLVNAARGGLLDEQALCDALDAGQLRAAALDVFDPEPPPADSRLHRTPNLLLSPHLAGASRETAEHAAAIAIAELGRFARGEQLRHVANPQALSTATGETAALR